MKNSAQLSLFEQLSRAAPRLSDEDIVRRLCEDLLDQAGVRPPVNVELLASMRGIARVEEREQPWAGVLAPQGGQFVVGVRSADGPERQRFTILHEAGHTLLPGFAESSQYRCHGLKTREEELCDIAASELLLPRRFFVEDLRAARPGLAGVEDLAAEYDASIEATALRVADLAHAPTMLIVMRVAHKPAERGREGACEPKLRVAWSHGRGDWPYVRRHKSADEGSPFMRAYDGEVVDEVEHLGDLASSECDPVSISARRYGSDGRVLALIQPASRAAA
jgi:IrrE N-terminal-like domain